MGGLDRLLASNTESLNTLPLEQRAMIPGGLPHALSIDEIASLTYPNNQLKQNALMSLLVDACRTGELQYYGDMSGWDDFREFMDAPLPNPFPKAKGDLSMIYSPDGMPRLHNIDSDIELIHRDDFKAYLQSKKQWPISGLLAKWWPDDELQADTETLVDNEEIKGRLNNQVNFIVKTAQELGYDDLLNIPIGGKKAIQTECIKNNPTLFTMDSFKTSWREANKRGLIRIENKEKFISNQ